MSTTLKPPSTVIPDPLRHARREVLDRLHHVRGRLRRHLLVEGLFWTTSAIMVAAAVPTSMNNPVAFGGNP